MDRGWLSVGEVLGSAIELHAIVLIWGLLAVHHGLLVAYWFAESVSVKRPIEYFYGFINPLTYLVALRPRFLDVTAWLVVQIAAFAFYWGTRWAALPGRRAAQGRILAAQFAGLVIVMTAVRDLFAIAIPLADGRLMGTVDYNALAVVIAPAFFGPLYAIPLLTARATIDSGGAIRAPHIASARKTIGLVALYVFVIIAAGLFWRPTEDQAREVVRLHAAGIRTAATQHGLPARTLGAILYVTHREHVSAMGSALEQISAGAFARDATDKFGVMKTANLSVGLMQVKPLTALTALSAVHNAGKAKPWHPSKSARGVDVRSEWFKRLAIAQLQKVPVPVAPDDLWRDDLIEALLEPRQSVRFAAFLLDIYATQWEAADPSWSIRDRPEILATLYQIGFERSFPKPNPRANDFGEAVLEAYRSDWLVELFPDAPATAPEAR